jgi:hypothetical protein
MKLDVDFSALWANANRMGSFVPDLEVEAIREEDFEIDNQLESSQGIEVSPEEISFEKGVLDYKGRQVVLFIPDHGIGITDLLSGKQERHNKFHVSDCRTLHDMRQKGRYDRYRVTNNLSGSFHVFGVHKITRDHQEGEYPLTVCKNCLDYLRYKGYSKSLPFAQKEKIFQNFSMEEFLTQYSTLFRQMPKEISGKDRGGYTDDWKEISDRYRASVGYKCEQCTIDLSSHKNLLHTHHKNGDKNDNSNSNLKALCVDCHRQQPNHEYMRIRHADMQIITQLRRAAGLLNTGNWQEIRDLADKSLDGVLRGLEAKGMSCPEVGFELTGSGDEVVCELELAWPDQKLGIAIGQDDIASARSVGWKVLTVGEAHTWIN